MISIIVAIIMTGIPALTTIITARKQRSLSKMHSAKQSILQMQMEDIISVEILKKIPRNYTNIHYEYDNYKAEGGNSDIDIKMKEYEEWYSGIKGGKK
jgi:hypothetical protein